MASLLTMAFRLLILMYWLTQQVMSGLAERGNSCNLDMAYNAYDDQYEGCMEEMEKKAPQLLEKELEANKKFNDEWKRAKIKWKAIKNQINSPKIFSDFHGTALVAYTGVIATDFNKAVREFRQNKSNFQYKAFHYYLTRALQLLATKDCLTVYRGVTIKFRYSGKGQVRFGQFSSSSRSIDVAKSYIRNGKGTLFTINTCLGADIKEYSYNPLEKEVLFPGYEVFEKVTVKDINETYNEISLDGPQKFKSNFNCSNSSGMKESPVFILLPPSLLILLLAPSC